MRIRQLPVGQSLLLVFVACLRVLGAEETSLSSLFPSSAPPAVLETSHYRFEVFTQNGSYQLLDKRSQVVWHSHPLIKRFGIVTLRRDGKPQSYSLDACEAVTGKYQIDLAFRPFKENAKAGIRVVIRAVRQGQALEISYESSPGLMVDGIRLLDEALWSTEADQGAVLIPCREGMLIPSDSGKAFSQRFDTYAYEGCHMTMMGVLKSGSALLATWNDPYIEAEVKSVLNPAGLPLQAKQLLSPSLLLRQSARLFQLQPLGRGNHVTVAQAYRKIAQEEGWHVSWDKKLKERPHLDRYFGAINFKLWSMLTRRMNDESTKEESVRVNWTFEEAAEVARHLKKDLRLDRVLFTLGGWIHRGYDNQHPDILPAAPELGGNDGLAACAKEIQSLGYLFCLHDNYQDLYRDSPSWSESLLMRTREGAIAKGGQWAGGRAYLICSRKGLELAQRPQNLPEVKSLTGADTYFIDTTYASGLQECFDPGHPLNRLDDMRYKQALSDYARDLFGSFGSECGREWAIPHSDFFEGLTGVSGRYYHNADFPGKLGAAIIPLFELVYRDTIALYGKYGYNPAQAAEYVLHHILIGRPLHHHNIPSHLYWKQNTNAPLAATNTLAPSTAPDPDLYTRGDQGWANGLHPMDRFIKNTYEIISPLNELTSRQPMSAHEFLTPDRCVQRTRFGEGSSGTTVTVNFSPNPFRCQTRLGGEVVLPPYGFVVEGPQFAAFCATRWNGLEYATSTLFTLRSQDGKALRNSKQVRVFHGFGDTRLKWKDALLNIPRERFWVDGL